MLSLLRHASAEMRAVFTNLLLPKILAEAVRLDWCYDANRPESFKLCHCWPQLQKPRNCTVVRCISIVWYMTPAHLTATECLALRMNPLPLTMLATEC